MLGGCGPAAGCSIGFAMFDHRDHAVLELSKAVIILLNKNERPTEASVGIKAIHTPWIEH